MNTNPRKNAHRHMVLRQLPALAVLLLGTVSSQAQTTTLGMEHYTYLPGETFTVFFQGGPGNRLDWIGIYPQGVEPPTASTLWNYVDGTQNGAVAKTEGAVAFNGGLNLGGEWVAKFFVNDGYTKLTEMPFRVTDPSQPYVRTSKRIYEPNQPISIAFTNGPGNAKDWIGVYPAGVTPGGNSIIWQYVGGGETAGAALTEGVLNFPKGLASTGSYVAHLLNNDGYDSIIGEPFEVRPAQNKVRVLSIAPVDLQTNVAPTIDFVAAVTNGVAKLNTASVQLKIDDQVATHQIAQQGGLSTISYTNASLLASASTHTYRLVFADDAAPPNWLTNTGTFTVVVYTNINLPAPLFLETFETTDEGKLPTGWTSESYTEVQDPNLDLQDLNSASYANWVVVNSQRFMTNFLTYETHTPESDYQRVLTFNPANVVNGQLVRNLAQGKIVFGDSGYRFGAGQYVILYTPDYNLTGKTNVYLSFHSIWEQNQDSLGSVEYSVDQGKTWLPIVYMLDSRDVLTNVDGKVDAPATFAEPHGDVPFYTTQAGETRGGSYSEYIGAQVTEALAPYISGRTDDDSVGSKRVELFKLAAADNQAKVRFRIAHAGTDSWYFGLDNFGLYSIPAQVQQVPLQIARSGANVTISWPSTPAGAVLQSSDSLVSPAWSPVPGVVNNSVVIPTSGQQRFYRLGQ